MDVLQKEETTESEFQITEDEAGRLSFRCVACERYIGLNESREVVVVSTEGPEARFWSTQVKPT